MKWADALRAFLEEMRGRKRPRTLARFEQQLTHFLEVLALEQPRELQRQHLDQYLAGLLEQQKPATAWGYLARILPFCRWLYRRQIVLWDPTAGLSLPRFVRPLRRPPSLAEVLRLLQSPHRSSLSGQRDLALLEFFYGTGLRLGEVQALEVPDVNLAEHCVRLRVSKTEPRWVPIGPHLAEVMGYYLNHVRPQLQTDAQEQGLWLNLNGQRLAYTGMAQRVQRLGRRAGLRKLSPHDLRRAYATHMLLAGAPLRWVQALLGHQSLLATQVYTQLTAPDVLREFQRTHPRARRKKHRERVDRKAPESSPAAGPKSGHPGGLPILPAEL